MKKVSNGFIYTFGSLGGLLFGYDIASVSGAILFIQKQLRLGSWQQGMVVSAVLIGAIIGALATSKFLDTYGRRIMLLWAAGIFFVGALGSGLAPEFYVLLVTRIVLGIGVGIVSALVPAYLQELAPKKRRGAITTLWQLMVMIGILLAYVLNYSFSELFTGWRWMLGFAALPAAMLFFGALYLPESPRFLVKVGKLDEAKAVLENTNNGDEKAVEIALDDIQTQAAQKTGGWNELFGKTVRPALITGLGVAVFQQIIGSNTVIFYAPTIFTKVGWGVEAALLAHIGIGVINVIVTVVALLLMDHIDRKKMLIFGASGMGLSLLIMSIILKFDNGSTVAAIVSAIALTVYVAFYAATWAPVTWVFISEVFPLNIRGLGTSLCAATNWAANMLVSLTFPTMLSAMGLANSFLFYAAICAICIWFTHTKFMETRGKSLEDIEADLRSRTADEKTVSNVESK
ncbi:MULTISPECIES: sugar porter family MFS transporter [Furfurilactobacillus]|uniref:Sugar porter family MFS transporter n=2 Tax=Furfurilactobacillus TaxID=2767882 RepID=A0ABT6DC51_9LACO|nr:sugar porter family MFS transporter [Furfurilactobacillus milii]QLE65617.1 major facilitator transporter [Furfurilactobacillus rossiae]MCF6161809.1 sugar porter family MFS transporter [Furfurilactobacillus milii]MCF6164179.1 sugar porter family MFS transporter [Furfurilactobacillus milii]MDF9914722.1 sugar porter family MFS transporter [Furfurilactobacillus milii]MYV06240.1 sugar porter family MFS transporter [Furfurilactobacillus milii]